MLIPSSVTPNHTKERYSAPKTFCNSAVDRLAERGGRDMHAGIEAQNGDNDTELRRENVPPEPKAAEQAVFR